MRYGGHNNYQPARCCGNYAHRVPAVYGSRIGHGCSLGLDSEGNYIRVTKTSVCDDFDQMWEDEQ